MTCMANQEWSLAQLCAKAEAYCAAAEHCVWEVRQKLLQWKATSEQVEDILAHLQTAHFIDEQRYCHAFVHDKLLYQGWGRIKIHVQLQAKKLPSKAIEQALQEIDDTEYFRILDQVMASKQRTIKTNDPQAREKTIRFLLQRGFTYEEISLRIK